jgi:hypothetical protein
VNGSQKSEGKATFENGNQYPVGIKHVIVNGKIAVEDERTIVEKAGEGIRNLDFGLSCFFDSRIVEKTKRFRNYLTSRHGFRRDSCRNLTAEASFNKVSG